MFIKQSVLWPMATLPNRHYYKNLLKDKDDNFTSSKAYGMLNFRKFANYVAEIGSNKSLSHHLNPHWLPYQSICHPCVVNYDYVAQLETLDKDFPYILRHLSANPAIKQFLSPDFGPTSPSENDWITASSYYEQLTTPLKYKLRNIYDLDFLMFDYKNVFL